MRSDHEVKLPFRPGAWKLDPGMLLAAAREHAPPEVVVDGIGTSREGDVAVIVIVKDSTLGHAHAVIEELRLRVLESVSLALWRAKEDVE